MKKTFTYLAIFSSVCSAIAQHKHHEPEHHFHPEMYSKDTIHIGSDSTMYHVDNLGLAVNEGHKSAGARVSPDGKTLYFFKVDHPQNLRGTRDIWVSKWNEADSSWLPATPMPEPVNDYQDNLVLWVSKDDNKLLLLNRYFKNKTGTGGLSMTTRLPDSTWSFPKAIKIKKYKNTDICSFEMSPDEEVLISAINQPGNTIGQQDLYVSFRIGKNKYSEPINMGNVINTKGIEATAFLSPDGKKMYFSSNGHKPSLGGFDIYESERLDDTWLKWSKPKHPGTPFNTKDDDLYFSVPDIADVVYLSRHFGGNKDTNTHSDIIKINLKELEPVTLLSGLVTSKYHKKQVPATIKYMKLGDSTSSAPISVEKDKNYAAELKGRSKYVLVIESPDHDPLYDTLDLSTALAGRRKMTKDYNVQLKSAFYGRVYSAKDSTTPIQARVHFFDKKTGKEIFADDDLPKDSVYKAYASAGTYTYSIKSEGYLKDTNEIDMTTLDKLRRIEKNFYLKKIEKGLTFTIRNILFKYNSHVLETYSHWELDRIADILKDSPQLEVEIGGHTDNVGNDAYNLALSQRRANSVVQYLLTKGITNKIHAKGYGEAKPVDTNLTPQGRGVNRRVEFVVLNIEDKRMLYKPTELKPGQAPPPPVDNPLDITK